MLLVATVPLWVVLGWWIVEAFCAIEESTGLYDRPTYRDPMDDDLVKSIQKAIEEGQARFCAEAEPLLKQLAASRK